MITNLPLFLGVCLLLAMVPGPGAMVVLRQAIRDGRRTALLTLVGNETALIMWGLAAAAGLTALIQASRLAYDGVRLVGAAVLVVIGVQSLVQARRAKGQRAQRRRDAPASGEQPGSPLDAAAAAVPGERGGWRAFTVGVITNLTNPKAGVFAMSFLPQFAASKTPGFAVFIVLAALWALVDALWFGAVIWFIGRARHFFSRDGVWRRMTQVSGVVLIGLGLRVAIEGS